MAYGFRRNTMRYRAYGRRSTYVGRGRGNVPRPVATNVGKLERPKGIRDYPLYAPPRITRIDQKYVEGDFQQYVVSQNGQVVPIGGISMGTGINNRLGPRVMLERVMYRGYLKAPTSRVAGVNWSVCDFYIVYDRFPNGVAPIFGDVFSVGSVAPEETGFFQRSDTRDRFELLFRKRYVLTGMSSAASFNAAGDRVCIPIDWNLIIQRPQVYDSSAATGGVADIKRGMLWLFHNGTDTLATACNFNVNLRVLFSDR